jgi:phage host-nuclease inhibitor protein Gam
MHVKNAADEKLDFFVFDNEGAIKVHYKMTEKDHKKISGLEKGIYTYQVFKKDEMSESGKIIIK